MSVTRFEVKQDKILVTIEEPTRYGKPDKTRTLEISLSAEFIWDLPAISKAELDEIKTLVDGRWKVDCEHVIGPGRTLIFLNEYEDECHSATYRMGAHDTRGPYWLIEDLPSRSWLCGDCGSTSAEGEDCSCGKKW